MHERRILKDKRVLLFTFYGTYVMDEANDAVLNVAKQLSKDELMQIEVRIMDLQNIDDISLQNSDRALHSIKQREIARVLEEKGCLHVLAGIKDYAVLPVDPKLSEVFIERIRRGLLDNNPMVDRLKGGPVFVEQWDQLPAALPEFDLTH